MKDNLINIAKEFLLRETISINEEAMTISSSGSDMTNKFSVYYTLQYEKFGTTIKNTTAITFKNRKDAEKFAKIAGSNVLTQTTSDEDEEIVALAKKQSQGKTFTTVTVMYPIDGFKTEFDVRKVYGDRNKVEYLVRNPSSIAQPKPKNVFSSAAEAADAIEKSGGKRPKIVKA
jgi:hypothetical protein